VAVVAVSEALEVVILVAVELAEVGNLTYLK
jgi:hypothetical protein